MSSGAEAVGHRVGDDDESPRARRRARATFASHLTGEAGWDSGAPWRAGCAARLERRRLEFAAVGCAGGGRRRRAAGVVRCAYVPGWGMMVLVVGCGRRAGRR